jgi:hypothetical protein
VSFARLSLLWKILLPTSAVLTVVFAIAGWIVQNHVSKTTSESVGNEARASFQAYESLWKARADRLATVSQIFSTMSDVRRVFGTGDAATIRDTAGEMWSRISTEDAFFLVADPQGKVIASLGATALNRRPDSCSGPASCSRWWSHRFMFRRVPGPASWMFWLPDFGSITAWHHG